MKNLYNLLRLAACLVLLLAHSVPIQAANITGGHISYTQDSANVYTVTFKLYQHCSSSVFSPSQSLYYKSANPACASTDTFMVYLDTDIDVTATCPQFPTDCSGGSFPGIKELTYTGTVILPPACSEYIIYFEECCRPGAMTNIVNASTVPYYWEAYVNTATYNNSPVFVPNYVMHTFTGHEQRLSFQAYDKDGDSLAYSLVAVRGGGGQTAQYEPFASPTNPIQSVGGVTLDQNGTLTFEPLSQQVVVIVVRVDEYRNGQLIGATEQDFILTINGNYNNALPFIHGIDSTGVYDYYVTAGDTVDFRISAYDLTDSILLFNYYNLPFGSDFFGTGYHTKLDFKWPTNSADARVEPYQVHVAILDSFCPVYGRQNYVFNVYVMSQDTSLVWPGDANNNLVADVYDLLPIGIAYNQTGPVRPNATTNWIGQPAPNWSGYFANMLNHKFADANGDGLIDTADAMVVLLNYGMTHAKTGGDGDGPRQDPAVYLDFPNDTLFAGDTVQVPIFVADAQMPVSNLYGLAFSVTFDPAIVDSSYINPVITNSWMGVLNQDLISIHKVHDGMAAADIALTRINQTNVSGYGQVGYFEIAMKDDIAGKNTDIIKTLNYTVSGVKAISADETELQLVGESGDVTVVAEASNINNPVAEGRLNVYPNPANDLLNIQWEDIEVDQMTIFDATGRVVKQLDVDQQQIELNTSDWQNGTYIIKIKAGDITVVKRFLILQ